MKKLVFEGAGVFEALNRAQSYLAHNAFSYGSLCGNKPVGIMRGSIAVQKWHNLSPADRATLDGRMTGDFREGPVTVEISCDYFERFSVEQVEALFNKPDVHPPSDIPIEDHLAPEPLFNVGDFGVLGSGLVRIQERNWNASSTAPNKNGWRYFVNYVQHHSSTFEQYSGGGYSSYGEAELSVITDPIVKLRVEAWKIGLRKQARKRDDQSDNALLESIRLVLPIMGGKDQS